MSVFKIHHWEREESSCRYRCTPPLVTSWSGITCDGCDRVIDDLDLQRWREAPEMQAWFPRYMGAVLDMLILRLPGAPVERW